MPPLQSTFKRDLKEEALLNPYKDLCYQSLGFKFKRVDDKESQNRGIDVIRTHQGRPIYIDEKAQMDYQNHDLPTFTFELGYFKEGYFHEGWLFDPTKITQRYYLFTNICSSKKGRFTSFKLTSVKRHLLIAHLEELNLGRKKCHSLIQESNAFQPNKRGTFLVHQDLNHPSIELIQSPFKAESPFNLKIRLPYLIERGIAYRLEERFEIPQS